MADNHTKNVLGWLQQLLEDERLSDGDFKAGFVLATKYLNRKSGIAYPSMPTLAADLNKSARRTQDSISALEDRRHITLRRGGKGKANVYRLAFHDVTETSDQSEGKRDENLAPEDGLNGRNRPINNSLTGQFCHDDRTFSSETSGRKRPPNHKKEPSEGTIYPKIAQSPRNPNAIEKEFEEFWNIYPKKVAKGKAEAAFKKARQSTHQEKIIASARQYAAIREGQDSQYTKHPATWLNAKCWDDELPAFKSENPFGDWPEGNQWHNQNPGFDLSPGEFEKTSEAFVDQPAPAFKPIRTGYIAVDTAFASEPDMLADFVRLPVSSQQKALALLLANNVDATRTLILQASQNFERRTTP